MMGNPFGPRSRASRRATTCLVLSASIAIAGCHPPQFVTQCVNTLNGELVQVVERGWGKKVRDAKGFEFWIDNKDPVWRCKDIIL
jgi:hypothetical protein